MSDRNGPCPLCKGEGQILKFSEWWGAGLLEECPSCEGTGFWGGAFPPFEEFYGFKQ
jgi:DnaJ-class molecular chaperone